MKYLKAKAANKSTETTALGIIAALAIFFGQIELGLDGDPLTKIDWNMIVAGFATAIMGWRARDANKTSEESELIK